MDLSELIEFLSSSRAGSIATTLAAIVSVVAAMRTMLRNSDAAQLRRKQDALMKVLASRALLSWDQLQTFAHASMSKQKLDPYVFPAAIITAKRLEESLDQALSFGLMDQILGADRHALTYHAAFVQSLAQIATLDASKPMDSEYWEKQHYLFGLVRLLDRCQKYNPSPISGELRKEIKSSVDALRNDAFSYLEESETRS